MSLDLMAGLLRVHHINVGNAIKTGPKG